MRNERLAGPEPYNLLVAEARTGTRFPDSQDPSLPGSYFLSLLVLSRTMDRYFNTYIALQDLEHQRKYLSESLDVISSVKPSLSPPT